VGFHTGNGKICCQDCCFLFFHYWLSGFHRVAVCKDTCLTASLGEGRSVCIFRPEFYQVHCLMDFRMIIHNPVYVVRFCNEPNFTNIDVLLLWTYL